LEQGLVATEVAGLADAQLDQPGDAMLHYLTLPAELVERGTPLPEPGRLELGLVWVQAYMPSVGGDGPLEAPRTQGAAAADIG